MFRWAMIAICLGLVSALWAAGPAAAHTLKIERAKKASMREEPEHCQPVDPWCDDYSVDNCRRPDERSGHWRRHRVHCEITMYGANDAEGGGPWHCHWTDAWSLRNNGKLVWSSLIYAQTYDGCPYDS